MRVGLIYCVQETNHFNPRLTTLDDFRAYGLWEGQQIIDEATGEVAGFLDVIKDSGRDIEVVPLLRARSLAGGPISREAFDYFQARIEATITEAGPLEALVLQLHGACAGDGVNSVEEEQAVLCRRLLGPNVPIVLALDHHANITTKLMAAVDGNVGHRTQPHDTYDTGRISAEMLLKVIDGAKPVIAWRNIPLVTHQEKFLTSDGPMKIWFDRARAMEADPKVLQVAPYPMQPWLDVEEGGWSVVVTTDNDPELADRLADEMAELAWSMRDAFLERLAVPVDEAVRKAAAFDKGIVVLSDTGDTVFGGAAGDSNVILESVLRQGITEKILIPMISEKAVAELAAAGEGAEVTLEIGGCTAAEFFTPLKVTGRVRTVADGNNIRISDYDDGSPISMGTTVIFDVGPATLLISELRGAAGNTPGVWRHFGVEPTDYKIAVMKTASNFQYYNAYTSGLVRADSRGPGQSDVYTLPWRTLPRPIYPLERITDWKDCHPINAVKAKARS